MGFKSAEALKARCVRAALAGEIFFLLLREDLLATAFERGLDAEADDLCPAAGVFFFALDVVAHRQYGASRKRTKTREYSRLIISVHVSAE